MYCNNNVNCKNFKSFHGGSNLIFTRNIEPCCVSCLLMHPLAQFAKSPNLKLFSLFYLLSEN